MLDAVDPIISPAQAAKLHLERTYL
jgi:hypothetical protein